MVSVVHRYPATPERLWRVATDFSTLAATSRGMVRYRGLPPGPVREGTVVEWDVSLFGLAPWQPYKVAVVAMDERRLRFETQEMGAGIRRWNHEMQVEADGDGSLLIETIAIEAETAAMTPIARAFAWAMYQRRHPARLRLLDDSDPWGMLPA